jgi:hypothetical protein
MSPPNPRDIKTIPALRPNDAALLGPSGSRDAGTLEAKQLASGRSREELARDAERAEHNRTERFRDHFERIAIWSMYAIAAVFAIVAFTWVYNLVMPVSLHYVTDDQVGKLQNIVTGGIIGVLLAHMKRRIGG